MPSSTSRHRLLLGLTSNTPWQVSLLSDNLLVYRLPRHRSKLLTGMVQSAEA